jgi:hypothetical protein
MSRNFGRKCLVSLSGSSSLSIPGGAEGDLRIAFTVGASTIQSPNPGRVSVFNPNPQTIAAFKNQEFKTLTLEAAYEDNIALIYSADVKQSLYIHEEDNVTARMDIFCAEGGNAYQMSHVNKALAAGWKPQDKVNLALDAMKAHGITGLGLVNVDLSQPARPRGRAIVGMARDILREVALSAGAVWSMNGGQVHILDHSKPVQSDGPVVLNSDTGLIGWPQQTENGIVARCLINPAIKVHTQVKIDESQINGAEQDNTPLGATSSRNLDLKNTGQIAADGIYRVVFLEIEGDTRSQPWWMTLTLLATEASPNQGQISAGGY